MRPAHFLQVRFAPGQQIVDDNHLAGALAQQAAHNRGADKPRASRDNVVAHTWQFGDLGFQVAQRFGGQPLGAGGEVESFQRYPSRVVAAPQDLQHRLEVVVSGPAVAAVHLVHVDVADVVEPALHQRRVRQCFVDGVVHVEHGLNARAADLAHNGDGFLERLRPRRIDWPAALPPAPSPGDRRRAAPPRPARR